MIHTLLFRLNFVLVLVAGLIFSTSSTLVVLLTVYSLFEGGSEKKVNLDTNH